MKKLVCSDCVCLVAGDSDEWICGEAEKPIAEVSVCPEGLSEERILISNIKENLDVLLEKAPPEDELDDEEVIDFYAEAKNLQEAIERLGF